MISSWFPVGRGCRQGDPIAPYLFLLCSKILAHIIRKDPDIKGYSLNDIEIKVINLQMIPPCFWTAQEKPLKMHFGSTQIQHLLRTKDEPRQNQVYMVWMFQAS